MTTKTILPFELLAEHCYLTQYAAERESIDCFTHGARIASPTVGRQDVFIKFYVESGKPNRGLINEAVGYTLAKACGLPVAPSAYLISVSGQRLLEAHTKLDGIVNTTDSYPCWASSAVDGALLKRDHMGIIDILRKWSDCAKMFAFDDWVANSDRTTANIVCTGNKQLTLIDHGHIGGSLNWIPELLPLEASTTSTLLRDIWPKELPKEIANQITHEAQRHPSIFYASRNKIKSTLDILAHDETTKHTFENFLETRALNAYERTKKAHGVLI